MLVITLVMGIRVTQELEVALEEQELNKQEDLDDLVIGLELQ
jgi:hypothetical protein